MSAAAGFEALVDFAAGNADRPGRTAPAFVPLFGGGDGAAAAVFDDRPPVAEPEPAPDPVDPPPIAGQAEDGDEAPASVQGEFPPPEPSASEPQPAPAPDHAALTARIAELEAGIVSLNERHLSEIAGRVSEAIAGLGARVTADVSAELALVLEAAILTRAQAEAVSCFAGELGRLISVGGAARVTVTGPEALLDALRASWKGPAPLPELIAGDGLDLVARVDDALLAARMDGLRAALSGSET